MLDWSGLLTPYAPPRPVQSNATETAQALAQAAQFQQKERGQAEQEALANQLAWAKLSQADRQKLADQALQQQHISGVNKYYDQQNELHKEQLSDKEEARKQKAIDSLRVAFRAAVKRGTSGKAERDQIRQQMATLGYNIGEEETDLPAPPAAPLLPPEAGGIPQVTTGKAKPVSKKFGGQLAAYMATPEATASSQPTGEQVDEEAGASTPVAGVLPKELMGLGSTQMSGQVEGSKQATEQKPVSRGGRYVVRDAAGIPVDTYDEPLERQKEQAQMEAAFAPLVNGARNEHEKAAALKASAHAVAELERVPYENASKSGMDLYKSEMGQFKKEGQGGRGGGGLGPKEERAIDTNVENQTMAIIKNENTVKKMANLEDMDRSLSEAQGMLKEAGRFGHNAALLAITRAFNGRAAAQREFQALQHSQSLWGEIEQALNRLDPGAPASTEILGQMGKAILASKKELEARRKEYGEAVERDVKGSAIHWRNDEQRDRQARRAREQLTGRASESTPEAGGTPEGDLELIRRAKAARGQ